MNAYIGCLLAMLLAGCALQESGQAAKTSSQDEFLQPTVCGETNGHIAVRGGAADASLFLVGKEREIALPSFNESGIVRIDVGVHVAKTGPEGSLAVSLDSPDGSTWDYDYPAQGPDANVSLQNPGQGPFKISWDQQGADYWYAFFHELSCNGNNAEGNYRVRWEGHDDVPPLIVECKATPKYARLLQWTATDTGLPAESSGSLRFEVPNGTYLINAVLSVADLELGAWSGRITSPNGTTVIEFSSDGPRAVGLNLSGKSLPWAYLLEPESGVYTYSWSLQSPYKDVGVFIDADFCQQV